MPFLKQRTTQIQKGGPLFQVKAVLTGQCSHPGSLGEGGPGYLSPHTITEARGRALLTASSAITSPSPLSLWSLR